MNGFSNYDAIWQIARQHQDELLREAAQHRVARLGRPSRRLRYPLGSQVRWLVGRALVSSGFWLLSRPAGRSQR